jgi:hypothetical protein
MLLHLGVTAKMRYGRRSRPQMAASFIRLLSRTRVYASPLDMRHLNHECQGDSHAPVPQWFPRDAMTRA